MRHSTPWRQRVGIDGEAVVLRGDLDLAGVEVLHRLVGAAVAELELVGLAAQRRAPAADGRGRCRRSARSAVDQRLDVLDAVADRRGVAGAVAEEDAVGLPGEHSAAGRRGREHAHLAAVGGQPPQDVGLDAVVVGGHAQRARRPRAPARTPKLAWVTVSASVRLKSYGAAQVTSLTRSAPSICGERPRLLDQLLRVDADRWRSRRASRRPSAAAGQRPGVDVGDGDDAVADQVVLRACPARASCWPSATGRA